MKLIFLICLLSPLLSFSQKKEIVEKYSNTDLFLENECSVRAWVKGYTPKEVYSLDGISQKTILEIQNRFRDNFGEKWKKSVVFINGFKYDLDWLKNEHYEEIKNYKWEIPKYILSYEFRDTVSKIQYCMHFDLSKSEELMKGYVPQLDTKYHQVDFISKEEALKLIEAKVKKKKKLKKVRLDLSHIEYNAQKKLFEWQFGNHQLIRVEAIPNGEVYFSKHSGIIDL